MTTSPTQDDFDNHRAVKVALIPNCDFCRLFDGVITPAVVDGATKGRGPWANMCDSHFGEHGIGLGLGKGQRLVLDS